MVPEGAATLESIAIRVEWLGWLGVALLTGPLAIAQYGTYLLVLIHMQWHVTPQKKLGAEIGVAQLKITLVNGAFSTCRNTCQNHPALLKITLLLSKSPCSPQGWLFFSLGVIFCLSGWFFSGWYPITLKRGLAWNGDLKLKRGRREIQPVIGTKKPFLDIFSRRDPSARDFSSFQRWCDFCVDHIFMYRSRLRESSIPLMASCCVNSLTCSVGRTSRSCLVKWSRWGART